ncbi:hypothetical protein EYF80_044622 [Liparis tanakae]|uniref:Uncharacterized protein n=1 Tax=Liparis tanakae TaxID=230148 RepID=A0A4Z2FXW3_9TELE|nr:hypothetical protein EYF80_044622 [Liparis tanakae]
MCLIKMIRVWGQGFGILGWEELKDGRTVSCWEEVRNVSLSVNFTAKVIVARLPGDIILPTTRVSLPGHAQTGEPRRNDEDVEAGKGVEPQDGVGCSQTSRQKL